MDNKRLETLCSFATESHARIQQDFADINPMIGMNRRMREMGVPADAVTIDHSKSNRRIILILHDHYPEIVNYQFSFKDRDPDDNFEQIAFEELNADKLYAWIRDYFQPASNGSST